MEKVNYTSMVEDCPKHRLKVALPAALPAPVNRLRRRVTPKTPKQIMIRVVVSPVFDFIQLVA